jgi:O-acetylserine/cysteine efflux transporter
MGLKDIIIALVSTSFMGLNIVIAKTGIADFPPFFFAFLRFFFLLPFIFVIPKPKIMWRYLIGLSLCWGFLYHSSINYALITGIGAGSVVLILQISTLFTVFLAALYLKEKPKFSEMLGLFICLFGIFLISWEIGLQANLLGIIALFVAGLSFSFGTIISKKIRADPFALIIWVSVLSIIPSFLFSVVYETDLSTIVSNANLESWAIGLFGSWGSALFGSAAWVYIVKKYPISMISPFRFLIPIFGFFFSILLLNETYPVLSWIGAGITLLGLGISQVKFNFYQSTMEKSN